MRADIIGKLDQPLATLTMAPNMAVAAPVQVQPCPPPTMQSPYPQAPMGWPHNSYFRQMFSVWPRGLVADTANPRPENLASTSQPVMLVQMPWTHWPTPLSSTLRDWVRQAFTEIKSLLTKLPTPTPDIVVCGDFNLPHLTSPDGTLRLGASKDEQIMARRTERPNPWTFSHPTNHWANTQAGKHSRLVFFQ